MTSEFPSTTPPENDPDLSDLGRQLLGDQSPPAGARPKAGWQPPSAEELQALLPQYEITTMLGRGGMGAVYMGKQISLDRPVAIKILSGALEESDLGFKERFKNEARAMAKLSHPGIVAVFESGETADGLLYIVMEYIEGTDVARMIAADGRLHTEYAMAITAHVCDALTYAHDRGIIHRDIKPANIMVGYDGVVKVADFGLAKIHSGEGQSPGLTMSGMAMGTMHFMAPEALEYGVTVDHRADIYAVGVMLYQMLTGRVPRGIFELPSMHVPGLDPRYDGIVAKAMREDREQRYQNAGELRHDLDAILTQPVEKVAAGDTKPAAALPTMARPQRPGRKRATSGRAAQPVKAKSGSSASSVVWAAMIVLALSGGAYWLYSLRDAGGNGAEPVSSGVATKSPNIVAPVPRTMEGSKAGEMREFGGIEMVWCPPGEFLMGSPEVEEGRQVDEMQHRVTLTKGFWMAKTECTQAQWQGVMGNDPSNFKGGDLPVEKVGWDDVQGYLTKMNSQQSLPSGWKWVLPSEAQWEYACRAGTTTMYAGNLDDMAWYFENSGRNTNLVGTKKANAWGLHDMHGNVWEWCADWYGEYASGSATDPTGANTGSLRVGRGGCWLNFARGCRAAYRGRNSPSDRHDFLGFRPALSSLPAR